MTTTAKARAQGLFIPVALVGALVTLLLAGAGAVYWAGRQDARATRTENDLEKLTNTVTKLVEQKSLIDQSSFSRQVEQAAKIMVIEREQARHDTDLRLLKDYVEGRLGNMPYRRRSE